jgi:hypothetical protein
MGKPKLKDMRIKERKKRIEELKKNKKKIEYEKFEIGQRVVHQYYGSGEIITFVMNGEIRSYMIKFDNTPPIAGDGSMAWGHPIHMKIEEKPIKKRAAPKKKRRKSKKTVPD